ncbi:uncharacterized protein PHACADRAFT_134571 [Phanerochaete carnosa HHB-10118-sp]|uniref:Sec39 domain-containing protein n=1 Tax=Phanerochaete carnosa (strain HHB-10118-sp) TaxID=650164 RepID=K5WPP0_PHACS|nr:uncharacterized protein PHACADRAFT_134571 [Phanerochaete carnosa HHB-10118-sp]EKM61214.1 hypothetical protein PHACADRAFT_134571 [Phanerochaete carnosa HHB-10118-sp]
MASSFTAATSSEKDLCKLWMGLSDDQITPELIRQCLDPITDDLWVTAACAERLLEDPVVQRSLLETGLQRTEPALHRSRAIFEGDEEEEEEERSRLDTEEQRRRNALASHFKDEPADAQLCRLRAILLCRLDILNTFVQICEQALPLQETETDRADDEWADDPWEDAALATSSASQTKVSLPLLLPEFLNIGLVDLACLLASLEFYAAVGVLVRRHGLYLWPYRFAILENIPEQALASEYRELLPKIDVTLRREVSYRAEPWRPEGDRTEGVIHAALEAIEIPQLLELPRDTVQPVPYSSPLNENSLVEWYQGRIQHIISVTGALDSALSLVQHAASQGLQGLDEIAEDLQLLSRLIYDVPHSDDSALHAEWSLDWWKSLPPAAAVNAFLEHATRDNVAKLVQKVVNPYLFVLEARQERRGHSDPELPRRLLYGYILQAPLDIVAGVFEASKPTLPPAQRLLRDDEDMARLALSCLYGSDKLDEWPTMSQIFECLPAWNITEDEDVADEADTTMTSLATYLVPSTSQPRVTPADLYIFFRPLPLTALSRALDFLDVHLESGEIFSRWSVPTPLRWFLQSRDNVSEQRAWANRMAHRAGGTEDSLQSQEDWEWLLEDMLKLSGSGESGLKGAFCLLGREEILRIFLSGLLSSGQFGVARNMLRSHGKILMLDPLAVEEICLSVSQEFYDNATSGNYHFGDMKLAYECLDVPRPSERILREKEFIEATSRLCAYNLMSRPGIPITPIEIRLSKDRLSLVSRVLSSNGEAYKHVQVILELVHKLGLRDDVVAEVKTLAMLTDTALNADDFDRAYETSEMMVVKAQGLRATSSADDPKVQQASEVSWVSCFQLGRHPEFEDTDKKTIMLGRAMELAPAETLGDVLSAWHRLEAEDLAQRREKRRRDTPASDGSRKKASTQTFVASTLASRLQQLHMPDLHMPSSPLAHSDAAALAGKAFHSVAANLPFGGRGRSLFSQPGDRSRSSSRFEGGEASAQATRVLQKGLGWLLGDES